MFASACVRYGIAVLASVLLNGVKQKGTEVKSSGFIKLTAKQKWAYRLQRLFILKERTDNTLYTETKDDGKGNQRKR